MIQSKLTIILMISVFLAFTACGGDDEGNGTAPLTFETADTVGDEIIIAVGSTDVKMIYANNSTSITFPTGVNDDTSATLTKKFFMSETEVTNALMVEVLQWAYDNSKFSATVSNHNGLSTTTVKYGTRELLDLDDTQIRINYDGSGSFSVDTGYENHPVVHVSWFGAIMFCNWLTEMRDGNSNNVVYSNIPVDGSIWNDDDTAADDDQKGYRLPTGNEWEFAARYIDGTNWTYGDHASGDDSGACFNDGSIIGGLGISSVFDDYAWYTGNSDTGGGKILQPVKQKLENHIGLFDMSGNVYEWCFTDSGSTREERGGCWDFADSYLRIGYIHNVIAAADYFNIGFRFSRTQ